MNKLTELANKHNCDKGTIAYEAHGYTEEYAKLIPSEGEFDLLEIGIWHGDSIRMWQEYNPELKIVGIDIDINILNYIRPSKNVKLYLGDQADKQFIAEIDPGRTFDYIIDDGSHYYNDILHSFELLYPRLKKGGFYFIEDLHASHAQRDRLNVDPMYVYQMITAQGVKSFIDRSRWACNDKLLIIQK